jgi:hypothetical protein
VSLLPSPTRVWYSMFQVRLCLRHHSRKGLIIRGLLDNESRFKYSLSIDIALYQVVHSYYGKVYLRSAVLTRLQKLFILSAHVTEVGSALSAGRNPRSKQSPDRSASINGDCSVQYHHVSRPKVPNAILSGSLNSTQGTRALRVNCPT